MITGESSSTVKPQCITPERLRSLTTLFELIADRKRKFASSIPFDPVSSFDIASLKREIIASEKKFTQRGVHFFKTERHKLRTELAVLEVDDPLIGQNEFPGRHSPIPRNPPSAPPTSDSEEYRLVFREVVLKQRASCLVKLIDAGIDRFSHRDVSGENRLNSSELVEVAG
jgi:hypothetical protein